MNQHGERTRKANPVKLSSFVPFLIDDLGFSTEFRLEKLKKNWYEIVGKANARNMKPMALKDGMLTVSVSSSAWVTQARFYKSSYIEKINSFDSQDSVVICDIRFILDRP